MKIVILVDHSAPAQLWLSETLANSLSFPFEIQQLDLRAVTRQTIEWADWVLLGLCYPNTSDARLMETLMRVSHAAAHNTRAFAIFQMQSRQDAPIAAAYGFAIARQLRQRGMALLSKPIVFFCHAENFSEREGELLRAQQWLVNIANQALTSHEKEQG